MNQNPTGRTTIGPARCSRKHCTNLATCIPVLRVPAKDLPDVPPLAVEFPRPLCGFHMDRCNRGEFMTKQVKQTVTSRCKATGRVLPDFSKAFLEKKTL